MKTCTVVFNISDEFVEEMRNYNPRMARLFRGTRQPSSVDEIFCGYDNMKQYTFKTHIENLVPGERVVVQVKDTYAIATFVRYTSIVGETPKGANIKYLVNRVDFDGFNKLLDAEKQKEELLAKMTERKKAIEEVALMQMLAEKDPEMKMLLEEYNRLK